MTLDDGRQAARAFHILADKLSAVRDHVLALKPVPPDASRLLPFDHDTAGNLRALAVLLESQAADGVAFTSPVTSPVSGERIDPASMWGMVQDLLFPLAYEAGELFRAWDEGRAVPSCPEVEEYAGGVLVVYQELADVMGELFPHLVRG